MAALKELVRGSDLRDVDDVGSSLVQGCDALEQLGDRVRHGVIQGAEFFARPQMSGEGDVDRWSAIVENPDRAELARICLLYTSPSPRDATLSRMPSSA